MALCRPLRPAGIATGRSPPQDSKEKIIHTVKASAANVADRDALPHLLHGKETRVWGDQAYRGQAMPSVARPPTPVTSRTSAIGSASGSAKPSRHATGPSRAFDQRSSTRSGSSRGSSSSPRSDTGDWLRTCIGYR